MNHCLESSRGYDVMTLQSIKVVEALEFHCQKCDHDWRNRPDKQNKIPEICPKCKSKDWCGKLEIDAKLSSKLLRDAITEILRRKVIALFLNFVFTPR